MTRRIGQVATGRHSKEQLVHIEVVVDRRGRLATMPAIGRFTDEINSGAVFLVAKGVGARDQYRRRRVDLSGHSISERSGWRTFRAHHTPTLRDFSTEDLSCRVRPGRTQQDSNISKSKP